MSDLMIKLGINHGDNVVLMDPTRHANDVIRFAIGSAANVTRWIGNQRYEVIMAWPRRIHNMSSLFSKLQLRTMRGGAIWVVMPKEDSPLSCEVNFDWTSMKEIALSTNMSIVKTVSITPDEFATRFEIVTDETEYRA